MTISKAKKARIIDPVRIYLFALLYHSGMSTSEAYAKAYPAEQTKRNTAVDGAKLLKRDDVQALLNSKEFNEAERPKILSRDDLCFELYRGIRRAHECDRLNELANLIDRYSRLQGYYDKEQLDDNNVHVHYHLSKTPEKDATIATFKDALTVDFETVPAQSPKTPKELQEPTKVERNRNNLQRGGRKSTAFNR